MNHGSTLRGFEFWGLGFQRGFLAWGCTIISATVNDTFTKGPFRVGIGVPLVGRYSP